MTESRSTFYIQPPKTASTIAEIQKLLQHTDNDNKVHGMETLLRHLVSSPEDAESMLMTVVRFVAASKDHRLIRLAHLFWESLPQHTGEEDESHTVLLMSQIVRNELLSPNEFVRGARLRELAKTMNKQMFATVESCVVGNLSNTFPYVRRNAAMCVYAATKRFGKRFFENVQDELVRMCMKEYDAGTRRMAVLALSEVNSAKAAELFLLRTESMSELCGNETLELALLELIRKCNRVLRSSVPPTRESREMASLISRDELASRVLTLIDQAASSAVLLEAAKILLLIWGNNGAKQACGALVHVLTDSRDVNVQLAVLDILLSVVAKCPGVIDHLVVDIARKLNTPSRDVTQKILDLILPAVTSSTVGDISNIIRAELISCQSQSGSKQGKETMEAMLLRAMRVLCTRFHSVALSVIHLLLDFLGESDCNELLRLIRELVVTSPISETLRPLILDNFVDTIGELSDENVLRQCVFLLGEFCESEKRQSSIVDSLYRALSPFPLPEPEFDLAAGPGIAQGRDVMDPSAESVGPKVTVRTVILPDGSYGTENILNSDESQQVQRRISGLRVGVTSKCNGLLISAIGVAVAKVCLKRYPESTSSENAETLNKALLVVGSLVKFCRDAECFGPSNSVTFRLKQCLKAIARCVKDPHRFPRSSAAENQLRKIVEIEREAAYQEELNVVIGGDDESLRQLLGGIAIGDTLERCGGREVAIDEVIRFRSDERNANTMEEFESSLPQAVIGRNGPEESSVLVALSRPGRAMALSGFSDPIYVEAVTSINHQDAIAELTLVNQTDQILQNVTISISTHGDLRMLDSPKSVTLVPGGQATVTATIRLSSTEAGVIFGYCSFERNHSVTKEYFNLSEMRVDLLDCIQRAWIGDQTFRRMWTEFEWENKITILLADEDVMQFLAFLLRQTKMTIVGLFGDTHQAAAKLASIRGSFDREDTTGDIEQLATEKYIASVMEAPSLNEMANSSRVFSVNLCAKSIFNEDGLLNLSLRRSDNCLSGSVRIRSRTQGIALSLGDRVAQTQRLFAAKRTSGSDVARPAPTQTSSTFVC